MRILSICKNFPELKSEKTQIMLLPRRFCDIIIVDFCLLRKTSNETECFRNSKARYISMEKYLECALAVTTHGVRGNVKLECRCDTPSELAKLKAMYIKKAEGFVKMNVISSSVQKNMVLTHFEGIDTVEDAVKLRGTVFYADRDDLSLPEGSHFIADLIGMDVIDTDSGKKHGVLEDVISPTGRDIYVVRDTPEHTFMIPCVPEFIREISYGDTKPMGIYVHIIDGMKD